MCFHFHSWNRCSSCLLTFNRRCNRVPCWNGLVCRWRLHRNGLYCRSGRYERADDEVYTHLVCRECGQEPAGDKDMGKPAARPTTTMTVTVTTAESHNSTGRLGRIVVRLWPFEELGMDGL